MRVEEPGDLFSVGAMMFAWVVGFLSVVLAFICAVQRGRILDLRAEVANETKWAATYQRDAITSNKLQHKAESRSRELADQVGDLEEQLRDARDEIERLARAI